MSSLQNLTLTRFKCFALQRVSLSAVTVLAGLNGMGKSTVIQALLLLRQSARAGLLHGPGPGGAQGGLLLNGELVSLGTSAEVLHEAAEQDNVEISVEPDTGSAVTWRFDARNSGTDLLPWVDGPAAPPPFSLFGSSCYYLGAERIGPRAVHTLSASQVERDELGADGTLAVAFLDAYAGREVLDAVRHGTITSALLLPQATAWMGEISPGVRIQTQALGEISRARLSFSFVAGSSVSRAFRPTSVGFGLSYTLPIVVALLAAPTGSLVLLENPEAHLHPRGQVAMGDLIARAARAGVQVIVETHSDHLLNGVRLAVHDGKLKSDAVALHFFQRETAHDDAGDRPLHRVISPRLDKNGRFDQRPEGFFDEWDKSLRRLLKPAGK